MLANFKSIPFFRIIISYILGIILYEQNNPLIFNNYTFFISTSLFTACFIVNRFIIKRSKNIKIFYSASAHLLLFFLPYKTIEIYKDNASQNHYSNFLTQSKQKTIGVIKDISHTKSNLIKLTLKLEAIELNGTWNYCDGKTIAYLKNIDEENLEIGKKILIQSKYNPTVNNGNPNEFDYKLFMERRNFFHTLFANNSDIYFINQSHIFSVIDFGTKIKLHVVKTLRVSELSKNAFSICSALIVGYDDEIDSEVLCSFSHSGTLHMLSVSGLHTGVIYGILVFIFSLIDKTNRFKITKTIIIIICLFFFVLITGISPSVLRASIMFTLIIIGKTFYREGNSYNTLFLSAYILLFFNPFLIYDIGFLLSYTAVFGILFLYPKISELVSPDNKILKWAWNGASVSIAATIFTLPITLYYFHQFPVWFALFNLIIIPIGLLNMFGGIILILFYKITFINTLLTFVINYSTDIMLWLTKVTNNESIGYIDNIAFTKIDLIFLIIIFFSITLSLSYKTYKYSITSILACIIWCSLSIINFIHQQDTHTVTFLNISKKRVYIIQKGNNILINAVDSISPNDFERIIKPSVINTSNINYRMVSFKNMVYKDIIFTENNLIPVSRFNASFYLPETHKMLMEKSSINNYSYVISQSLSDRYNNLFSEHHSLKKNGALIVNLD